jgi:hypothetical protein
MNLSAFLNPMKEEACKVIASKRFIDEDGKPIEWELRSISADEDEAIRRACTKRVPVSGRKGQFTQETDLNKYLGLLAVACTVYPNLNDVELQNGYNVMGADNLLKTMLHAGEYTQYVSKVQELNGYDSSMDELVDEAKN